MRAAFRGTVLAACFLVFSAVIATGGASDVEVYYYPISTECQGTVDDPVAAKAAPTACLHVGHKSQYFLIDCTAASQGKFDVRVCSDDKCSNCDTKETISGEIGCVHDPSGLGYGSAKVTCNAALSTTTSKVIPPKPTATKHASSSAPIPAKTTHMAHPTAHASATPTSHYEPSNNSGDSFPGWKIGVIVGIIAACGIGAGVVYFLYRRRGNGYTMI